MKDLLRLWEHSLELCRLISQVEDGQLPISKIYSTETENLGTLRQQLDENYQKIEDMLKRPIKQYRMLL